jgi:hypothetical protein
MGDKAAGWTQGTVLGFSLIVAYWGKFASNQWRREEAYLRVLWDLEGIGQDAAVRPDFHGEEVPSPIDKKLLTQEYPVWKARLRTCAAWFVTLLFCAAVLTCTVAWMDQFSGRVSMVGSICLALMIQVFSFTFNNLVEMITIFENHKLQRTFYESYLRKAFVFEFVNQYTAFFYIAIKQQFTTGGCPRDDDGTKDCLLALKKQLPSTLLILMSLEIFQVMMANFSVKAQLKWEHFQTERSRLGDSSEALAHVLNLRKPDPDEDQEEDMTVTAGHHTHNFVEVQGKFGPYRTREQIETMTRLCLNIGFVLIFGGIVPIIVPMCLLAFLVQLRAKAVLLTTAIDRPVPRRISGLGPWLNIIDLLMECAILFTAYVFVNYGPMFNGQPKLSKVSGFIMYVFVVKAMWSFHDLVSPASSDLGDLLRARRDHILSRLVNKESEKKKDVIKEAERKKDKEKKGREKTNFVDEAIKGEWHKIPTIRKMPSNIQHDMGLQ